MNAHLHFDFKVNKEKNSIQVQREFAANLDLVWAAWTTAELLDQWWAPKPYQTKTKTMDFREGGHWLYAMFGPDNATHWCKADYQQIDPFKSFTGLDAFCDEEGNVNDSFPRSLWTNRFTQNEQTTMVNITIQYNQIADLEMIIELGFKEGFTAAMGNLDKYLEAQGKLRAQ
jgi:PhnB protein